MGIFREAKKLYRKVDNAVVRATTPSWRKKQKPLDPDFSGRDNVVNLRAQKDRQSYDVVIDDSGIHVGYQDKQGKTRWRKAMDVAGEVTSVDTGSPPSSKNPNRVWARTYKTSGGTFKGLDAQVKYLNDLGYNVQALDKRPAKAWRSGDVAASDKFVQDAMLRKEMTGDPDYFGPYIDPHQAHSTADREFRSGFFRNYTPVNEHRGFIFDKDVVEPHSADKPLRENKGGSWRSAGSKPKSREYYDQTRPVTTPASTIAGNILQLTGPKTEAPAAPVEKPGKTSARKRFLEWRKSIGAASKPQPATSTSNPSLPATEPPVETSSAEKPAGISDKQWRNLLRRNERRGAAVEQQKLQEYQQQAQDLAVKTIGQINEDIKSGGPVRQLTEQQIHALGTAPSPDLEKLDETPESDQELVSSLISGKAVGERDVNQHLLGKTPKKIGNKAAYNDLPLPFTEQHETGFTKEGDIPLAGYQALADAFQHIDPKIAENFRKTAENLKLQKTLGQETRNAKSGKEKRRIQYQKEQLQNELLNTGDPLAVQATLNRPVGDGVEPILYPRPGEPRLSDEGKRAWGNESGQGNTELKHIHVPGGVNQTILSRVKDPSASPAERVRQARSLEAQINPTVADETELEAYLGGQKPDLTPEDLAEYENMPRTLELPQQQETYNPAKDVAHQVAVRMGDIAALNEANTMLASGITPSRKGMNELGDKVVPYTRKNAQQRLYNLENNTEQTRQNVYQRYYDQILANPPEELANIDPNASPEERNQAVSAIVEKILGDHLATHATNYTGNVADDPNGLPNVFRSTVESDAGLRKKFGIPTDIRQRPSQDLIRQLATPAGEGVSLLDQIDDILFPGRREGKTESATERIVSDVRRNFQDEELQQFRDFMGRSPEAASSPGGAKISYKLSDDSDDEEIAAILDEAQSLGLDVQYNEPKRSFEFHASGDDFEGKARQIQDFARNQPATFPDDPVYEMLGSEPAARKPVKKTPGTQQVPDEALLPFNIDTLKSEFGLDQKQAEAVNTIYEGMGLDEFVNTVIAPRGSKPTGHGLYQDDSNVLYQDDEESPVWRDTILGSLESWQSKGSPEQLIAHLNKTRGAIEQADYIGLMDYLQGKKSVTRDEIAAFVTENQVNMQEWMNKAPEPFGLSLIDEPTKGRDGSTSFEYRGEDGLRYRAVTEPSIGIVTIYKVNSRGEESDFREFRLYDQDQVHPDEIQQAISREFGKWLSPNNTPKYAKYQEPGGENYRELLLTNPIKGAWEVFDPRSSKVVKKFDTEEEAEDYVSAYPNLDYGPNRALDDTQDYNSIHWDQANILAHLRMNDRTDEMGNKILHIEENQSDWHQAGRKQGYQGKPILSQQQISEKQADIFKRFDAGEITREQRNAELDSLNSAKEKFGGVPDAPFKKSWPSMAMKRAIKLAADEGYDKVSWTPGDMQADRYSTPGDEYRRAGMKSFYDKMLPTDVDKIVKKYGTEVRSVDMDYGGKKGKAWQFDVTPAMREDAKRGMPLFQAGMNKGDKARAAVEFRSSPEGEKAVLYALTNPNVSSPVHELAHIARKFTLNEKGGFTKEQIKHAEDWCGVRKGHWTKSAEEKFARGFEKYLHTGKAPTATLKKVFAKFKNWLKEIYGNLVGSPLDNLDMTPQMKEIFDLIVTRKDRMKAAADQVADQVQGGTGSVGKSGSRTRAKAPKPIGTPMSDSVSVSPSVKLAQDYAAANPDYNGDHTKWKTSSDFPVKTWSDFDPDDPASSIGLASYKTALDQAEEFENDDNYTFINTPIERAIESYAQNAADTAIEQGLGAKVAQEALDAVYALARINRVMRDSR